MNDSADVVTLIPKVDYDGFSSMSFSGGEFAGVATREDPFFYLVSPPIPSSQPALGQRGYDRPIDSTTYNKLALRLFSSSDDVSQEFRIVWNHGAGYAPNYTVSAIQQFFLKPGWHTYTIDLDSVAIQNEGTPRTWSSEAVTGLRISFKTVVGTSIKVDWVSLHGSAGCGTAPIVVSANQTNDARFYNLYLDTDGDPTNGFVQQVAEGRNASGIQNFNAQASGLVPGAYVAAALGSSDYATIYRNNAWDMSDNADVLAAGGINQGRFEAGAYRGTTGTSPLVYLKLAGGGIPAASFSRLSFKLQQSVRTGFFIYWNSGSVRAVNPASDDPDGDGIYHINLSAVPQWSGTIQQLMISPSSQSGIDFALDFVTLEPVSFRNDVPPPVLVSAPGSIRINSPPLAVIRQPDSIGGEGRYPWNMGTPSDIPLVENLKTAEILPFNVIGAEVGDFFHGVNPPNEDDPINWSRFFTRGTADIDTSLFYRLSYRLLVEGDVDLVLGSVARVYWTSDRLRTFGQSQDVVVYGGWNTYTVDLRSILLEDGSATWNGTVDSFRVDAHEFMASRPYYFDFIHLRADDRARERFYISYTVSDPDTNDSGIQVDLAYSTSASCTSSTPIASFVVSDRAAEKDGYLWDTSGVPAGSYFICLTATDGLNNTRSFSSGVVTVTTSFVDAEPPALSLAAPSNGTIFDSVIQVKGFALDRIQLAELRVLIDGALSGVFYPSAFDREARTAFSDWVDSSNAGFNRLIDTSSLGVGPHTVEIRATDTAGNVTTQSLSVSKQAGATLAILPDETPNGVPVSVLGYSGNLRSPVIASISTASPGIMSATIRRATAGCSLALYVSASPTKLGTKVAEKSVTTNGGARGLTFRARRVSPFSKLLYLRATTNCGATVVKTSQRKKFRISGTSKRISAQRVINEIRKRGRFI